MRLNRFYFVITTVFVTISLASTGHAQLPSNLMEVFPSLTSIEGSDNPNWLSDQIKLFKYEQGLFSLLNVKQSSVKKVYILPGNGQEYEPKFDPSLSQITLGPIQVCPSGQTPEFISSNLHEFAHSVFMPNLNFVFGLSNEPAKDETYNFFSATLGKSEKELSKLVSVQALSGPFDELFADLVAVIVRDDPEAMQQSMSECSGLPQKRSFTEIYPVQGWNGGSLKPTNAIIGPNFHEVLSPARRILWESYKNLQYKNVQNAGAIIIATYFNASMSVIRDLRSEKITYKEWFVISKPVLVEKLTLNFKAALTAAGY